MIKDLNVIKAIIMAGGSGTRLWPLSRAGHPKQFLALDGKDTMLQTTIKRLEGLNVDSVLTICNEEHRFLVAEQLREIKQPSTIVLEPVGRDTAPAIAVAAFLSAGDSVLLVLAADHIIKDETAFKNAVAAALPLAEDGKLVTFGVVPNQPHTGFGYIKKGNEVISGFLVDKFVEKPTADTAQKYLESGDYLWNSGMFLFKASRYLEELKRFQPDIFEACRLSIEGVKSDLDFLRISKERFIECPSKSIDYGVMERTSEAVVVPIDAGWSDIGSWTSLWDVSKKDVDGNVCHGDVLLHETKNCFIRTEGKLVASVGLDDLVIVSTKDVVMVAQKDCVQDVKLIVKKLQDQGRTEWKLNREVYRPWGSYDSIDYSDRYQVKRITVNPGAKLSVQMHHHRAEHWVVVSGCAKVTNGDETFLLSENESTYIPIGIVHALENPGKVPLEIIEIQSGSYLGEDDIVRFEDRYGRV